MQNEKMLIGIGLLRFGYFCRTNDDNQIAPANHAVLNSCALVHLCGYARKDKLTVHYATNPIPDLVGIFQIVFRTQIGLAVYDG
jgi:hypothetical protein